MAEKETQKLVVHNPAVGIEMQPNEREIFAVLEIAGFQFKVVADDQVVCEYLEDYDINEHIVFDKVLMVGTKDYTSIGRPFVETAKVFIINNYFFMFFIYFLCIIYWKIHCLQGLRYC